MEQILDFSIPFDVNLFDRIVGAMYSGALDQIQKANTVLTQFKENPNAWTKVIQILQNSSSHHSKALALQILNDTIKYRWNILPSTQQVGMKNFLVTLMISVAKKETKGSEDKLLLLKLNECLIQIVKKEWPEKWPKFIPEIVDASKDSESLCENNMKLLKLLSEEVFDFSSGNLTTHKTNQLKQAYMNDFMSIFHLCEHILQKATKESLILETLQTLQRFISWIPLPFIFETSLIHQLVSKFLPVYQFRNDTLRCLVEVLSSKDIKPEVALQYKEQLREMYKITITCISQHIFPGNPNIPKGYSVANNYDQQFVQILGLFLCSFFDKYLKLLEEPELASLLKLGHEYMIQISNVDDAEIFKTALDYWKKLTSELFKEKKSAPRGPLSLNSPRINFYSSILSSLRLTLVTKMAKPEEVIIVEDENGNLIKERYTNVASIELYNTMRRCLIYLTKLDYRDMEAIMSDKLNKVQHSEWSWNNLNTLCWAIGSISGHMERDQENRFLVDVIKALLELCDHKTGKPNKAVIASNIMYVVGQYSEFLNQHWRFLQTVVLKLFEFMHETFEGVQEMACETFLRICGQCSHKFVIAQGKGETFAENIVNNLGNIICDLESRDIQTFYEAMGYMILQAQYNPTLQRNLQEGLMRMPNESWNIIVHAAGENVDRLKDTAVMKEIVALLRTNVAVCKTSKGAFEYQISKIFNDMFEIYKIYSMLISQEISTHGEIATKYSYVRLMTSVKGEVLRLMETFFKGTDDVNLLSRKFVPPLLQAILTDYYNSVPDAKDVNVLSLLTSAIQKLKQGMSPHLPSVLRSVIGTTIPMIKSNFSDYPDHRKNLFQLLNTVNQECFEVFFQMEPSDFQTIIQSVLWAILHDNRQSYETGLQMLDSLLTNIHTKASQDVVDPFYRAFYTSILTDIFGVLTDTMHISGFKYQSSILRKLILVVTTNQLRVPLYDNGDSFSDNRIYVQTYIANKIANAFPNLSREEIQQFVIRIFENANNEASFTDALRDFLVVSKEWSNIDTREMYFEDREREAKLREIEDHELKESKNSYA